PPPTLSCPTLAPSLCAALSLHDALPISGHPPDLVQAEYQALTTLAARDTVADLSAYTTEAEEAFHQSEWSQVTMGTDSVYAIPQDRKSTRLNSSHVSISYAVFCLKKQNT